jgi:hypothetical protein
MSNEVASGSWERVLPLSIMPLSGSKKNMPFSFLSISVSLFLVSNKMNYVSFLYASFLYASFRFWTNWIVPSFRFCIFSFLLPSGLITTIGHVDSVGLFVCKLHISATRWRFYTQTAVALQKCRATTKNLNDLLWKCPTLASISSQGWHKWHFWNMVMGVIWHEDFNSGVAKELTHVECLLNSQSPCGIIRTTVYCTSD